MGSWETQELVDCVSQLLHSPAGECCRLERLLRGISLPAVQPRDGICEPYRLLLTGIWESPDRASLAAAAAGQARILLQTRPGRWLTDAGSENLLYNLLHFCAALRDPDTLGEPLYEIYRDQRDQFSNSPDASGSPLSDSLRDALRAALVTNQQDSRLQSRWQSMISVEPDEFLRGNRYDGFAGIRNMPASASREDRGRPALNAIGEALFHFSEFLAPEHTRRIQFRRLLRDVESSYLAHPTDYEWMTMADQANWPDWCVTSLNRLIARKETTAEGDVILALWRNVATFLPFESVGELCRGTIRCLRTPKSHLEAVQVFAEQFEQPRRGNPYPSDKSADAMASLVYSNLDREQTRSNSEPACVTHADAGTSPGKPCKASFSLHGATDSLRILLADAGKDSFKKASEACLLTAFGD